MAGETGTEAESTTRSALGDRLGWIDGSLLALVLVSIAVIVLGGLVWVGFGAYSMSIPQAWNAVFDPSTTPGFLS